MRPIGIICSPAASSFPPVPDASRVPCTRCKVELWCSPASRELLARGPKYAQCFCAPCYQAQAKGDPVIVVTTLAQQKELRAVEALLAKRARN